MVDISATIVTLNEEENIRDCLETLTWCDEIIIVDSYSDDATVEIAKNIRKIYLPTNELDMGTQHEKST